MVVGISSGLSVCLAVPSVLVAGGDIVSGVIVIADCKMESIGTGAVFFIGIVESVGARRVVRGAMPSIAVAGLLGVGLARRIAESAHSYAASCGCLAAVAPHRPYVVIVVAVVVDIVVIGCVSGIAECCGIAVYLVLRQGDGRVFNGGFQRKTEGTVEKFAPRAVRAC